MIVNPAIFGLHKQLQVRNTTTLADTILKKSFPVAEIPFT
jgi:hypothetical protein